MTQPEKPRLELHGLTKNFGGICALDGVNLTVMPGEVHGLLGSNGSGKSTLIKILSGFHAPDSGRLKIDGRSVALPVPLGRSETYGLTFVHQNLGLLPEATVLENLIAGDRERLNPWHIPWRSETERANRLFAAHQLALDPWQLVEKLSPVERAQLAIIRAAERVRQHRQHGSPGVLVLDEPTPFLPSEDTEHLFTLMRGLAKSGVAIIFVSHDIDEILTVTTRSTVLRDGKVINTFDTANASRGHLVEAIVGRALVNERRAKPLSSAAPAVQIEGLSGQTVKDINLSVQAGEILGLTGLIGSGYDEVPILLAGGRDVHSGWMTLNGTKHLLNRLTPRAAIAAGIVFIPADRSRAGIASDLSLTENATLPLIHGSLALNHRALERITHSLMQRFAVKASHPRQMAAELSGGNQQKLVLSKWLQLCPHLVLLDEPTQGIDVGARQEIYDRLNEVCADGGAIICASSEFEQLESIAHRVLIFERGHIKVELKGRDVNKSAIAGACYAA